jgi:hypothetical protein
MLNPYWLDGYVVQVAVSSGPSDGPDVGLGFGLGEGVEAGVGVGVGTPPIPAVPGLRKFRPAKPTIATIAIPAASRIGVLMGGVLHGIRRSRSWGVVLTARRTASTAG